MGTIVQNGNEEQSRFRKRSNCINCTWRGIDELVDTCPQCGCSVMYGATCCTGGMTVFMENNNVIIKDHSGCTTVMVQHADCDDLIDFLNEVALERSNVNSKERLAEAMNDLKKSLQHEHKNKKYSVAITSVFKRGDDN